MANCSDNLYTVKYTDKSKTQISVAKGELITDKADIALVGKTKRDYGEIFDENILHLLENFACPEDGGSPGTPDLATAFGSLLENPTEGQIWFNTTQQRPFVYDGTAWKAMGTGCDIAGNYGVIAHGESLPRPVCPVTGYEFLYSECTWVVSPFNYPDNIDYMRCVTDANAVVTMEFRILGGAITEGQVNYQIIGIRDNSNQGTIAPEPSPPPGVTPSGTPTVSSTPTPTTGATPTPTASPSATPPPTFVPGTTPTPTPTSSRTPTPTPSNTPGPTPSNTASNTPTPTAAPTPTPTPTPSDDKTGDVNDGQNVSCLGYETSICVTLTSSGLINGLSCNPGFASLNWLNGGFRAGEDGSDYSFTATFGGDTVPTGPVSGNFGSSHSWCLPAPGAGEDNTATVTVTITGPAGTAPGVITIFLTVFGFPAGS